jgi:malonyl-CoA O-methyltransferase
VLVPINDDQLMIDVVARLGLPAVVVARTTVGTINHTLLTIAALRHRGLDIAAVVMSGVPDPAAGDAIRRHGGIAVVELPVLNPLGPASVESWAEHASATWRI